jgi:hypothetical protein
MPQLRMRRNRPPYLHDSAPVETKTDLFCRSLAGRSVGSDQLRTKSPRWTLSDQNRNRLELAPGEHGCPGTWRRKLGSTCPILWQLWQLRARSSRRDGGSAAIFTAFAIKHVVPGFNLPKGRPGTS